MELTEVKSNLNKMVAYKGKTGIYKLTACILRKQDKEYVYTAELFDVKHGNSVLICDIKEIEVVR